MVAMDLSKWVLSLILGACVASLVTADTTPVFLWTNKGSLPDVSVPGGQHMSNSDFNGHIIKHLVNKAEGNVIALLHDKLSLDDITKYGDVYSEKSDGNLFHNLKKAIEDHTSLELPSVHDAESAIQELASTFKGPVHYLEAPHELSKLSLNDKQRHLVVVHLPTSDGDEKKAFQQNDNILGKISSQLEKLGQPYTALYTGRQPSKVERAESLYMGRHLLVSTTPKPSGQKSVLMNYSNCMYLYMKGLKVQVIKPNLQGEKKQNEMKYNRDLIADDQITFNFDNVPCPKANQTARLSFNTTDQAGTLKTFQVKMQFNIARWEWKLTSMNIDYDIKNGSETFNGQSVAMDTSGIGAAKGFSYHCTDLPRVVPINASTSGNANQAYVQLVFKELQIQVQTKAIKNNKFGDADDCVGFFTIPIWSGIIAGVILTAILAFGIIMLMNISTMDRFDDPKGKTITVNVAE